VKLFEEVGLELNSVNIRDVATAQAGTANNMTLSILSDCVRWKASLAKCMPVFYAINMRINDAHHICV
jgi:hypothetical protein